MRKQRSHFCLLVPVLAAVSLVHPWPAHGQADDDPIHTVVIRRTIPSPHAVQRQPLTSDRLSTTSTRYIDARRGFRPFSTVDRRTCGRSGPAVFVGFDDTFGISRAEDRPLGVLQRAPRTYVSRFGNPGRQRAALTAAGADRLDPAELIVDKRSGQVQAGHKPAPATRVHIHHREPALPQDRGAVIISADGTVFEVGG